MLKSSRAPFTPVRFFPSVPHYIKRSSCPTESRRLKAKVVIYSKADVFFESDGFIWTRLIPFSKLPLSVAPYSMVPSAKADRPWSLICSPLFFLIFNDILLCTFVQFPNNVICPSVFWAFICKDLLYLLFYIHRFLSCADFLFVDMCMFIHSCIYVLRCTHPLKDFGR